MAKFFPHFREEVVLREQVTLLRRNYTIGMLSLLTVSIATAAVIFYASHDSSVFFWLLAMTTATMAALLRHWLNPAAALRTEALIHVWSLLIPGAIWGLLSVLYIDGHNLVIFSAITVMTAGLTSGAIPMQAPCLPVFIGFSWSAVLPLALVSLFQGDALYMALGITALMYLAAITLCAWNFESTVAESIQLRFANLDLIERLRQAMEEATEANRAKSVFLASASHDLRQPLHAMGLFIETLNGTRLDEQQKNILSYIDASSDAARGMLNTLLNFSKLDAGVIKPEPATFRLQDLFNKLEGELAIEADRKNLIYRTRETRVAVHADIALVELILRNLIINAIRYTQCGGVLVAARQRGNVASVEVWDTGIGIAPEEQQNIFREFHQLDNPERDRHKGFGLGLAIAKGLAKRIGTQITLASRPGAGSVFRLTLPLSSAPLVEDIPVHRTAQQFDGKCVLIIDDDSNILLAMETLLSSWGLECLLAESAQEAIDLLKDRKRSPDILITDYRLRENRTGKEAIASVRDALNVHLPAIIITGDTAPDRLREAQASDALLLHKPLSASGLQRALSNFLDLQV